MRRLATLWMSLVLLLPAILSFGQQQLLVQGNGRLATIARDGKIEWEMPWAEIHDVHRLDNGHFLVQQGASKLAEIDPTSKKVVWTYDSATQNGNAGKKVEVHSFQPLKEGRLMVAESGIGRIIEIDHDGKLLRELKLKLDHPHPHTDTRLVRKLDNGNFLVCHEGDGAVREYDGQTSQVVWEFEVPLFGQQPRPGHGPEAFGNKCFAAVRLASGNTLVSTGNGHSILEVTPGKQIVWQIHQRDLPNIVFAWVTTLEVLPNGNYLIGNCHAGPNQPVLIEIQPKSKTVVWAFDGYSMFGNNVSNTLALETGIGVLR